MRAELCLVVLFIGRSANRNAAPGRITTGRLRCRFRYAAAVLLLVVGACATTGGVLERAARDAGWRTLTLSGRQHQLRAAYRLDEPPIARLHVYLGGDGTPWVGGRHVAANPTSRDPQALRLMARDTGNVLYLGRPCYHGLSGRPECGPMLWTHGRYSEAVVSEMAAALGQFLYARHVRRATLIGYSGGGTLAMLLAERLPAVDAVVTIAANLDIDAWARLHGYSRLTASLNPVERPPLPARIRQLHLVGTRDKNVPPSLVRDALRSQSGAVLEEVSGASHHCCWDQLWPAPLDLLPARVDGSAEGDRHDLDIGLGGGCGHQTQGCRASR
jgi:pimeloyl-ACP methyl ester carboxylesterase